MRTARRRAWMDLAHALEIEPDRAGETLRLLEAYYSQPHRRFHTLEHIEDVLRAVDRLVGRGEHVGDLFAVRLAAWFHDAVYEPGADDNELRSAALAETVLYDLGLDPQRIERVSLLIMATRYHIPDTPDAAVLVDADLSILGAAARRYARYRAAIRAEFGHLSDEEFAAGRAAFLRSLGERPLMFHTATMRRWRERRARANVRQELAELEAAARGAGAGRPHAGA